MKPNEPEGNPDTKIGDLKDFYELKSRVAILEASQTRLDKTVSALEKLKQAFAVAITLFVFFGLSGGVLTGFLLKKIGKIQDNIIAINTETQNSSATIQKAVDVATNTIARYANSQLPMLSQEATNYLHRYGIKSARFTWDGQHNWRETKITDTSILCQLWESSQPDTKDNYLELQRP